MSILAVEGLSYSYSKDNPILKSISFKIEEKDIFCLLGPNGSGKSTLLSQILFPDKRSKNHLKIYGKPVGEYSLKEISKIVSFVPQQLPPLRISVLQAVLMGRIPYNKSLLLKPYDQDIKISMNVLKQLGMDEFAERELNTLSGGEIQRVFIAQAIVKNAKIYFFDEPMAALDPEYQTNFLKIIQELSDNGASVIFTSHNPNHLFSIKNARMGMLDKNHNFIEINEISEDSINQVEEIFNGSLHIRYSKEHGEFVAMFNN